MRNALIHNRLIVVLALMALFFSPGRLLAGPGEPASSYPETPWQSGLKSRVRLISGPRDGGAYLSGLEIQLEQGAKTYWRTPGESGLAPRIDWEKSNNVAAVDALWPTPTRIEEGSGTVIYGYKQQVIIPLRITAKDPARPIQLRLTFDYGVCKEICIPASADLALDPPQDASAPNPVLDTALRTVPKRQSFGMDTQLSILSVTPLSKDAPGGPGFKIVARIPPGASAALFPEFPDGWYAIDPGSAKTNGSEATFTLTLDEAPKEADNRALLRLTLAADGQSIETETTVGSPFASQP